MNSAPISTACASLGRLSVCILGLQSAEATVEDRFINAQQICPHALWMKSTDSVEAHWEKLVAQTGSLCSLWTRNPSNEDPRLFSRSSSHCLSLQGGNSYQTLHTLPLHLINIQLKLCNSFLIFVKKQTKKKNHPKSLFATYVDAQRTRVHVSSFTLVWSALVLALTYCTGGKCHTASALLTFMMSDSAGRQNPRCTGEEHSTNPPQHHLRGAKRAMTQHFVSWRPHWMTSASQSEHDTCMCCHVSGGDTR